MTLFEIDQEIKNCIITDDGMAVSGITGEYLDTDKLDALKIERSKKIRNIACWGRYLDGECDGDSTLIAQFTARKRRDEALQKRLKEYLQFVLDGEKVKADEFEISYRKSTSVEIENEKMIPNEYRIPQPSKIDKKAIGAALKGGEEVPGADLVTRQNIQIK